MLNRLTYINMNSKVYSLQLKFLQKESLNRLYAFGAAQASVFSSLFVEMNLSYLFN